MSKELKTSVSLETTSAEQKLKRLAKAIEAIEKAIKNAGSSTTNLENGLQDSIDKANKLETEIKQIASAQKQVTDQTKKTNKAYKHTDDLADSIFSKVKGIASAYLGVMGMQTVINTSDMITSSENKLNAINDGDKAATQEQMDAMYGAAQRSRTNYADMLANVSKSMTLSPDAFGGDMNNAIAFQEIMGKSYSLGGASAAEQSSSMYQMIQALGSGKLSGDELRSVTEGAPLAAKEIEAFAREVYGTEMALKDMGSRGMITSEIVVAAMLNAGDKIDEKFQDTAMTFAQAGTQIKNSATKAFEPVLQKLNQALNALANNGFFDDIANAFSILAMIANGVVNVFMVLANNWNWLKVILTPLAIGIFILAAAMVIWAIKTKVAATWARIMGNEALMAWLKALWPVGLVVAAIALVIMILRACGVSFAEMAGAIVGAVLWVASVIWNTVIGIVNAVIQFLWTSFVEPWIGIIEWVLNVFNGGFDSFGDAVKNLLGNIISWFLSLGQVVTKIIDAIFGTNWTGGLENLKDKVLGWGKNENSITLSREAPTVQSMSGGKIDRWSSKDAYNTGFDWASNGVNSIGEKFNTDWDEKFNFDAEKALGSDLGDIASNADKTAGNTGKMADSMEIAAEDLELLRDLAEMEWKKEFTTANITVDMSNYNTVNGMNDLDGIVTYLRDGIIEEMSAVANGAYSIG